MSVSPLTYAAEGGGQGGVNSEQIPRHLQGVWSLSIHLQDMIKGGYTASCPCSQVGSSSPMRKVEARTR